MSDPFAIVAFVFYLVATAAYFVFLFIQTSGWQKAGFIVVCFGFAAHTALVIKNLFSTGRFPSGNFHETLILAAWVLVGVFLTCRTRFHLKVLGVFAAPLSALMMIAALRIPPGVVAVESVFKSYWVAAHIVTVFIGEAAFALACGASILYLIQERAIKTKKRGFFFKRLPSLEMLDATANGLIRAGFVVFTAALILGFIYARMDWGKFFTLDPKELWSTVTWLVYAVLLHQRIVLGWRGKRTAVMAVIGFALVLFTFFGVNFLMEGHHEKFTRF